MTHIPGSYIRDRYEVPAELGGRIRFEGRDAWIADFDGQYLLARYENAPDLPTYRLHPTEVDYLDARTGRVVHKAGS